MTEPPANLKVFLSHRYKSPDVNLYFSEIFHEFAQVYFEVDAGPKPISMTRLERMIQNADAFVGIYPFPDPEDVPSPERLIEASQYFRLEQELALRSGKPALAFYDRRYKSLLEGAPPMTTQSFDFNDVTGADARGGRHRGSFLRFVSEVTAFSRYQNARPGESARANRVAILVPESALDAPQQVKLIAEVLFAGGFEPRPVAWPPKVDRDFYLEMHAADWCVADIGETALRAGISPFLHGQFLPALRMFDARGGARSPLEETLFGAFEVGYCEDILAWTDESSLREGLEKRIALIKAPVTRINNHQMADDYFRSASKRKESVFLSYSGKDQAVALKIGNALRQRFQVVFDYQDGKSITPGASWMNEIYRTLNNFKIGVPLYSRRYFDSPNCVHEAEQLIARKDQAKMFVFPFAIDLADLNVPEFAESTQYATFSRYLDAAAAVEALVSAFNLTPLANEGPRGPDTLAKALSARKLRRIDDDDLPEQIRSARGKICGSAGTVPSFLQVPNEKGGNRVPSKLGAHVVENPEVVPLMSRRAGRQRLRTSGWQSTSQRGSSASNRRNHAGGVPSKVSHPTFSIENGRRRRT